VRKLTFFLAAVFSVLFAEKALCHATAFSIESKSLNSFRYEEMRVEEAAPLSIRTGRFLSVDPAMDLKKTVPNPQMWNRYAYVINNPIRYTDPDGREHLNEPGFTKSLSEANWSEAPPEIRLAFNAQGALLSMAAGGMAMRAASNGLFAAAIRFPRAVLALMGIGAGMTGAPSVNLGSGARPIAGAVNVDSLSPGFRGNMQQIQVAGDALALPFKNGSIGNVTAQNLPSMLLGQGGQKLAGELSRTMQSGSTLSITTQTPGALKAFAELLSKTFKDVAIEGSQLTAIRR
jgi:hypothetical protein